MKRYPIVIATTAAGLGAVLGFHPATSNVGIALPVNSSKAPAGSQTKTAPAPTTTAPAPTTTGTSGATPKSSSPKPASSTTTSPNPSSNAVQSATGQTENYGYGQLAVKATISGSKITSITLAQLQVAESYSQSIASQVIPLLKHEVLKAQSLNVNGFTGATYTTEAYLYSLQSALHKLHFK